MNQNIDVLIFMRFKKCFGFDVMPLNDVLWIGKDSLLCIMPLSEYLKERDYLVHPKERFPFAYFYKHLSEIQLIKPKIK